MKNLIIVIFTICILASCSKPIPESKLDYVGEWESSEMYLYIGRDGTLSYHRLKNGSSTEINASVSEFIGDDFISSILFFDTTFEVSQPPYEEYGNWYMVVDGVKLIRKSY